MLLVEGASDVKVFQRLLRLYGIEHEVVLLPLGGATLIRESSAAELEEITRITTSVAAVIDSERNQQDEPLPADREAFVETCNSVGIRCTALERRATENYFTDRAVKAALGDKYSALGHYDSLKSAAPAWGKNDNWRVAGELLKRRTPRLRSW